MVTEPRRAFAQGSSNGRIRSKPISLLTSTALIPVAVAFAVAPGAAHAQSWDGGGDPSSDWNNPANWSTDSVPTAGNNVVINTVVQNQPVLSTASAAVNSTSVPAGTLTIGGTLTSTSVQIFGFGAASGRLIINPGGTVIGLTQFNGDSISTNNGTISGAVNIGGNAVLNNAGVISGSTTISGARSTSMLAVICRTASSSMSTAAR